MFSNLLFGALTLITVSACVTSPQRDTQSGMTASDLFASNRFGTNATVAANEHKPQALIVKRSQKEEGEAKKKEVLESATAKMEAFIESKGVTPGTKLWLKEPLGRVPGFTQLIFKEITVTSDWSVPSYGADVTGLMLMSAPVKIIVDTPTQTNIELTLDKYVLDGSSAMYIFNTKISLTRPAGLVQWPKNVLNMIAKRQINIGMTSDQLVASWGTPQAVNISTGSWGRHSQYVYGGGADRSYVYLKNGRVSSMQD